METSNGGAAETPPADVNETSETQATAAAPDAVADPPSNAADAAAGAAAVAADANHVLDANVIDRSAHPISRRSIPENVLKVLYRLHRSGYRAYLCGGSVRDLLMDRTPKDFDVVTDAHPAEVRRLFRNSRIIGRRFRLVHIIFQDQVVEVATFRREPERTVADVESEDFLITDDNTFGSPLQDARRRDFTINALFYNIADFSVIDYVGGLEDLAEGRVRVIGDPDLRFREDPVRMMRAIEFASRLGFEIEQKTYEGILRHRNEILKASPPRVSEEILELLRRGWSRGAIRLMVDTALLQPLLPEIYTAIRDDHAAYFWKMLEVLDRTVQAGRKISDAVLLAVLMLPWVIDEIEREEQRRDSRMRMGDVITFIRDLTQPLCARMSLAAGTRHQIEQALETLWRLLEPPTDRRSQFRAVYREPFNDALALLELYALSSGRYVDVFRQWQAFAVRVKRAQEEAEQGTVKRRRRRRR
ncbi:MAG: polynucleotide adenylyltransferase PcnB [Acidobacteria bacterium]|nr:polynucleotide adenylyltransferase PcnB [Acidobacteriota bacterium]MBV9474810.1 polynucleotide adenylyltransferase PcnB [Acidobacteriota bacterium]